MSAPVANESALLELFETYTASPDSIGRHFSSAAAHRVRQDPLLVATASDMVLYPGGGAAPQVEGFRLSTRGFKELAGVSHLGPALASLVVLREQGDATGWYEDAERLLGASERARAANDVALWRDEIAVPAYAGREAAIAAMVDHACAVTSRYLQTVLSDPDHLRADTLQTEVLDSRGSPELPVGLDRVMIATFFLTGMDVASRLIDWFDEQRIDWSRTMVIIAGKQGRPTAGVTWDSNSVAGIVLGASRGALPLERLLLAPHAPVFASFTGDLGPVAELETTYRSLWAGIRAAAGLGAMMFPGAPPFAASSPADRDPSGATISGLPAIDGPDDWPHLVSRLRVVLEDPRQLLSGAVTDYATRELVAADNDPGLLVVPGLDGEPYPALS